MRIEATIEQWRRLYDAAERIKELKPWESFWDLDLIGIRYGKDDEITFVSVLGRGGDCYGLCFYEGYEGLNSFLMLTMQEHMNLPLDYVMNNQRAFACYWGNREELTNEQRKIIKDLGRSYRGKNRWLYFMSFEPGYYPFNLDADEVERLTEYLCDLELALKYYKDTDMQVDFESGNMFLLSFGRHKKTWSFGVEPLPFTAYAFGNLVLTDKELIEKMSKSKRCDIVLEAEVVSMHAKAADPKYDRPINPSLPVLVDAVSEMVIKFEMTTPDDDVLGVLAEILIDFVLEHGAPKEVRVTNVVMEAALEHVCQICDIKLRRVKKLPAVEGFKYGMHQFLQ